ncbi:MAG: phosphotransferase [Actinomycetota bacterium]|nr:phosphotransferase [Actinomycetota bacterium]
MEKQQPPLGDVVAFLRKRFGAVDAVSRLAGGAWSSAFAFEVGGHAFVVRFGRHVEDYHKDRLAAGWSSPGLPVPAVLEIGAAFDGAFVVSERLRGDKHDALPSEQLAVAVDSLLEMLVTLATVELPGTGYGASTAPSGEGSHPHWRDYLLSVPHRDQARIDGWRQRLAGAPFASRVFDRALSILEELAPRCPDVRHVVHGDLLYGNVLGSPDDRVSSVIWR